MPSWGDRNRTPSSVIFASFSSETIWKLEGVQLLRPRMQSKRGYQPTTISEDVAAPSLELVSTADRVEHSLPWLEAKVVGVVET